ncbi:ABC transporter ATP-binding protein [Chelativorans sp. J32]|uniref:ABC transporter ATP-binding protein n=1 Tax=Chelativorans sp. J32 TaxID=935840 RepID=UPI000480CEC5|nr:ABC transporter ATP-binding protein [Chelativorans sp. J32]
MSQPVLDVRDLIVEYKTPKGPARAVNEVSFSLRAGERFGLVGESGSGKSTTVLALMRMLRGGRIAAGEIRLNGVDLAQISEPAMRRVRFAEMSLVPQGAMSSLNPVLRIGDQMADIFEDHGVRRSAVEREGRIERLLEQVGLPGTVRWRFPHELSGGMKQRVCIAMSIALRPSLILADEPTSALDVVVQKQVLGTLSRVQRELGAAIILIGHDMALMAHFVSRIGVMYAGRLVETGPVRKVFAAPRHPYTKMLIEALPSFEKTAAFKGIPGVGPSLLDPLPGCPFHNRCPMAIERCRTDPPAFRTGSEDHHAACHRTEELADA